MKKSDREIMEILEAFDATDAALVPYITAGDPEPAVAVVRQQHHPRVVAGVGHRQVVHRRPAEPGGHHRRRPGPGA